MQNYNLTSGNDQSILYVLHSLTPRDLNLRIHTDFFSCRSHELAQSHASKGYANTHTSSSGGPTPSTTTSGSSNGTPHQYTALTPKVIREYDSQNVAADSSFKRSRRPTTSTKHRLPMQRFQADSSYPYAQHNDYQAVAVAAHNGTAAIISQSIEPLPRHQPTQSRPPLSPPSYATAQSGYQYTNVLYYAPQHQPYDAFYSTASVSYNQEQEEVLRGVGAHLMISNNMHTIVGKMFRKWA